MPGVAWPLGRGQSEADGKIARPHVHPVHARHCGDFLRPGHTFGGLDHDEAEDLAVDRRGVGAEAVGRAGRSPAANSVGGVVGRRGGAAGVLGGLDRRDDDALGARVEGTTDQHGVVRRDPHQRCGAGAGGGPQHVHRAAQATDAVLLVEVEVVETGERQGFRDVRIPGVAGEPDRRAARFQDSAQPVRVCGCGAGIVHERALSSRYHCRADSAMTFGRMDSGSTSRTAARSSVCRCG